MMRSTRRRDVEPHDAPSWEEIGASGGTPHQIERFLGVSISVYGADADDEGDKEERQLLKASLLCLARSRQSPRRQRQR